MHHVTLDSSFYSAMVGIYVVMVGIYVNNGLILRKMSVSHDPGDPFLFKVMHNSASTSQIL